jgi:mRNA interferase HigB
MLVLNEWAIARFSRKYPKSRRWLERWVTVARVADWRTIQDVQADYPAADGGVNVQSEAKVTVFDVGGNKFRLIADVIYRAQTVTVLDVMTHAEYSKDLWKRKY